MAQRVCFAGRGHVGDRAWPEGGAATDQDHLRQWLQLLPQGGWRVDEHGLQADHRRGATLDRVVFRDLDQAKHLNVAIGGLRNGPRLACHDRAGGVLGVEGAGLATQPAIAPIGAEHLEDADAAAADRGGEARAVGAGALDPEHDLIAEAHRPVDELLVTGCVGGEAAVVDHPADDVERNSDVDVFVGVDADGDSTAAGIIVHADRGLPSTSIPGQVT